MSEAKRRPLVLIIEDDKDWQESIQDSLKPLDVRLEVAGSLRGGVEIAEEHPPASEDPIDLVILDMRIPAKEGEAVKPAGGITFLKQYCLIPAHVPVIVFTAYPDYDNCVESIKAGAHHYLPKADPRPGVDSSQRLFDMCRDLLARREGAPRAAEKQPDEHWFEQHHREVRGRHARKFAAFVPAGRVGELPQDVERDELDGVTILVAESYKALRSAILHDPDLQSILPLIVYIEAEPGEGEDHE